MRMMNLKELEKLKENYLKEYEEATDFNAKVKIKLNYIVEMRTQKFLHIENKKNLAYEEEQRAQGKTCCISWDDIVKKATKRYSKDNPTLIEAVKTSVHIEMNGETENSNVYRRGELYAYYTENSKSEYMKNRRLNAPKLPPNVSPDYTDKLYDIKYEIKKDGKIDKSNPISFTLNPNKAEDLIYQLGYQFKIKYTILTFFLKGVLEEKKASCIEEIQDYITGGEIDLSRGIYANQRHHININKDVRYWGYLKDHIFSIAIEKIKAGYFIKLFLKDKLEMISIYSIKKLNEVKDLIDWRKSVLAIEKLPREYKTERWNEDYDGVYLRLRRLSTKSDIAKYQFKFCITNPLRKLFNVKFSQDSEMIKSMLIGYEFEKEVKEELKEKWKKFSYSECNRIFKDSSIIKQISKYYREHLGTYNWESFKDIIFSAYNFTGLWDWNRLYFIQYLVKEFAISIDVELPRYEECESLSIPYFNSLDEAYESFRNKESDGEVYSYFSHIIGKNAIEDNSCARYRYNKVNSSKDTANTKVKKFDRSQISEYCKTKGDVSSGFEDRICVIGSDGKTKMIDIKLVYYRGDNTRYCIPFDVSESREAIQKALDRKKIECVLDLGIVEKVK